MTPSKASALCLRIFDAAESIDLEQVRALSQAGGTRPALKREGSQYVQLSSPPVQLPVGPRPLTLSGGTVTAEVSARVFDFGSLSVQVKVPCPEGKTLEELIPWADEVYDSPAIDALAREVSAQLRTALAPAMKDTHLWEQVESFTVLHVTGKSGGCTAQDILEDPALPRLILGETQEARLAQSEVDEVLQQHFSYGLNDLVVVDWNAAFVFEPSGSDDIPYLLEIANAQLLELRYYDAVLDRELGRAYDTIELHKSGQPIFKSPYKRLMRELMLTLIELTEFIERVENSIKIVGDTYLARVYAGSLRALRVDAWQQTVTRKQRLLKETYELLKGEVDTGRSLGLETLVVLLILIELLLGLSNALRH
jgi:hypothetical protein